MFASFINILTLLAWRTNQFVQIYLMHKNKMQLKSTLLKNLGSCVIYPPLTKVPLVQVITCKTLIKQSLLKTSMNRKFFYKYTCAISILTLIAYCNHAKLFLFDDQKRIPAIKFVVLHQKK